MGDWDLLLNKISVIPVLVVDRVDDAIPLAEVLVASGLPVLEVTLRTPAALDVIEAMAEGVPEAIVGAGTLLKPAQFAEVADRGGRFCVSPGATLQLLDAAAMNELPYLPGAQTVSETMVLAERGYQLVKFFPAGSSGGVAFLKTLSALFPMLQFCPTGGITPDNADDYLSLESVACVGGSWIAPRDLVSAGDWSEIEARARWAAKLNSHE